MKLHNKDLSVPSHWLLLLILTNLFFIFLTWLISPANFSSVILIIFLFTVIIVFAGYQVDIIKQKRQMEALEQFLNRPDEETQQQIMEITDEFWHPVILSLSNKLSEQAQMIKSGQLELKNYQEYIEACVHEIKTPLSLATLVLANHKEEMSSYVYQRMEHVNSTINNDVERILYYARLQAEHVDYKFVKLNLSDCVQESLEDFKIISEEKKIDVELNISPYQIISDKKVLAFIFTQIFGNAFKYTAPINGIVQV